ncbi:ChrR family anti-sigma-E factor [Oricola indica]|uniref:ChrR family anti-sigma-E factor n=1 Tax=Oricola indica TaxID=2872591 RepID=UPI003CCBA570
MIENKIESMDVLLARFVAGTLPKPVAVLVAAHLELSPDSRMLVRALEASAGDLLEAEEPLPLTAHKAMLDAVLASSSVGAGPDEAEKQSCAVMPRVLRDFVGYTADTIPWKTKMPGYREYDIGDVDGCHVSMMWIKPGRKMPAHTHDGMELTLVLDGAFSDTKGRFGRGDISIADDSVDHRPMAENDRACIAFAVTDAPLRMTGPLHQRIADIFGAT